MRAKYKNKYSSARVVPAQLDGAAGVLELIELYTHPNYRGKGYATQIMRKIIDDADKEACVLMLRPSPFGLFCTTKLIAYHQKFGFIVIQDDLVIMARQPKV